MGYDYNNLKNAFKSVGSPVTNVPAKQFFADYMSSPMYKRRLNTFVSQQMPDVNNLLNTHVSEVNGPGSIAYDKTVFPNMDTQHAGFPINSGTSNINVDRGQMGYINKQYGVNQPADHILAHELSHVSRQLSPSEELFIAGLNNKKDEREAYNAYIKSGVSNPFSEFLHAAYNNTHDARPSEIKADLDAFRYSLYKKGIYDTAKRNMTVDDFNKAGKDPEIKNSLEYKRLTDRFKPEHIIQLNNSLASAHAPIETDDTYSPTTSIANFLSGARA